MSLEPPQPLGKPLWLHRDILRQLTGLLHNMVADSPHGLRRQKRLDRQHLPLLQKHLHLLTQQPG